MGHATDVRACGCPSGGCREPLDVSAASPGVEVSALVVDVRAVLVPDGWRTVASEARWPWPSHRSNVHRLASDATAEIGHTGNAAETANATTT